MSIKKCINIFICLLFTFIFVFNSVVITYASTFVAGPVAVKTFMLILASMGLIGVVNTTDWGSAYTGFKDFVKDKYDATSVLASKAYNSVKDNVKLNYSDIKNDILEYSRNNLIGGDVFLTGNFILNKSTVENGSLPLVKAYENNSVKNYRLFSDSYLTSVNGDDYSLGFLVSTWFGYPSGLALLKNGEVVPRSVKYYDTLTSSYSTAHYLAPGGIRRYLDSDFTTSLGTHYNFTYDIKYHEDTNNYSITWNGIDYSDGNKELSRTFMFDGLYSDDIDILNNVLNPSIDIPVTDAEEVAFPIDWVPGFVDSTGKTLDEILEELGKINDFDWEKALEGTQVNELNPPIIKTDVNGVITSVDTASSSITSSINTSTNRLIDSIKSIFTIGNSTLDFSPLKELELKNKFPFCLPYDLHKSIKFLQAEPKAPRFDFTLMGEKLSINFEMFEPLSKITRAFFSFLFTIAVIFFFYKNLI